MVAFGTHTLISDYVTGLSRTESLETKKAGKATKELMRSESAKRIFEILY